MKLLPAICLFVACQFCVVAQDVLVVRSRTEQFVVYGAQSSGGLVRSAMQTMPVGQGNFFWFSSEQRTNEITRVHLVPGLVAVSCERIKEAVLHELGETDRGGRMIHIQLSDRRKENDISIFAGRSTKGWLYSVELPVNTSAERFSSAMAEVLLTEIANRNSPEQTVDVPLWLMAGFIAHLQAASVESLVLQPNLQIVRDKRKLDPGIRLRERFQDELPLTFEEMSWPENLASNKLDRFQESAQLFIYRLLQLQDGRGGLKKFLTELPRYKNWQFAFLAAFKPHFSQLLDVEKWWALQVASLGGRDFSKLYSPEESWEKMKSALDVPAQIHLKSNRLPVVAKITLQEVIQHWDTAREEATLRKAINQLRVLRVRAQPELVSLVDDYRKVLEKYLEQKTPRGGAKFGRSEMNLSALKRSACYQLDALDERRSKLRQIQAKGAEQVSLPSKNSERRVVKKGKTVF